MTRGKYSEEEKKQFLDFMRNSSISKTHKYFLDRDGHCPHIITLRRWKNQSLAQQRSLVGLAAASACTAPLSTQPAAHQQVTPSFQANRGFPEVYMAPTPGVFVPSSHPNYVLIEHQPVSFQSNQFYMIQPPPALSNPDQQAVQFRQTPVQSVVAPSQYPYNRSIPDQLLTLPPNTQLNPPCLF